MQATYQIIGGVDWFYDAGHTTLAGRSLETLLEDASGPDAPYYDAYIWSVLIDPRAHTLVIQRREAKCKLKHE